MKTLLTIIFSIIAFAAFSNEKIHTYRLNFCDTLKIELKYENASKINWDKLLNKEMDVPCVKVYQIKLSCEIVQDGNIQRYSFVSTKPKYIDAIIDIKAGIDLLLKEDNK
jgi:hypothetical protein